MYKQVKSCVFKDGQRSEFFISDTGMRQGETLTPLLVSLFVNDIEEFLLDSNCKYIDMYDDTLNNYLKLFVLMYTDDTLVMANSLQEL